MGLNNVQIKEGDEWKAVFKTNRGLYKPTVIFFGMYNSPPTFQAMMDNIFEDLIKEGIVIIYMDDMFLLAKTKEQLRENTRQVLQQLMENDLYFEAQKVQVLQRENKMIGNGHTGREDHHGPWKVERNSGLASPYQGQASARVPGIWKFLSTLHLGILQDCLTP